MQDTFTSVYGKVVIENGALHVCEVKQVISRSQLGWLAFRMFIVLRFISLFFEDDSSMRKVNFVFFSFLLVFYGAEMGYAAYKSFFLQSFAKRIPLKNIIAYRLEDNQYGLETYLFLKLRSGRERKLAFRKLEKQVDELVARLSADARFAKLTPEQPTL